MHRAILTLIALLVFCATLLAQPEPSIDRAQIAGEIRAEFMHAWNSYKKYAWGYDVLRPLSKTGFNWYAQPLYLTPLEAFDTMVIMGFNEEADTLKKFLLKNISFDKDMYVKNFEISIRMLGGLMTAYQLTGEKQFLDLAKDLGDRLLPVYRTPTGLPYVDVNLKTGAVRGSKTNPGEIGTVFFEFGVLSKLTGDPKYYNTVKYALLQLFEARSPINLVGTWLDADSGKWLDPDSHISACIDSYYEILVKGAMLFDDNDCKVMWKTYQPALNRYLLDTAASGIWYGHADMNTGKRTKRVFGALDAFYPA
ncbi:glycoside hydrolase family 47, partial [bacterium]|nr:glycoside hydrolase family 47 [bacterium]